MAHERITWRAHLRVDQYDADQVQWVRVRTGLLEPVGATFEGLRIAPSRVAEIAENLLTTAGLTRIMSLIIAGGGQAATATSARIGTGNGAGTAAVGDTNLSAAAGSANRWFQVMDASYPAAAGATITLRSSFGTSDGNYAWNEWGIDIGTPTVTSGNTVNATLLNHKTSAALGTKASGGTWVATATLTLA